MEIITSLDNEKVKYWNKLNKKKYRDQEGLFLVEGDHLVLEALKNNCVKEIIMDSEKIFPIDIPKYYVTKEILSKISLMPSCADIIAVCRKMEEKELGNRLLLIDSLQDPGNLGTIIRSAVAFEIDTIVIGDNTVDLYNEKTIRATEGMLFNINIIRRELKAFIKDIKELDYKVFGTSVEYGVPLKSAVLRTKYALIVGNEGNGIDSSILELCDENIYIPMANRCESLNVAIASGIILYELGNKYNE